MLWDYVIDGERKGRGLRRLVGVFSCIGYVCILIVNRCLDLNLNLNSRHWK